MLTGIQAARGKQGNDLIVHSERFFLCSAHVQVSDLGWLEKAISTHFALESSFRDTGPNRGKPKSCSGSFRSPNVNFLAINRTLPIFLGSAENGSRPPFHSGLSQSSDL